MDGHREAEIVVGTYEDYVVGYQIEPSPAAARKKTAANATKKLKTSDSSDKSPAKANGFAARRAPQVYMEQSFAVRGHSGSVRCLASSLDGALVFSAGQDEMMNLFSLRKRKLLQTSEGAATCSNFVESSHLICGSEDGNIYIHECQAGGMKLVKTLKGHKAPVTAIDTHKTGKVMLSLSRDKTMRTWNLIKGRCAYVTHIGIEAHLVKWARGNDGFLVAAEKGIYYYNQGGILKQSLTLDKRVNSIEFVDDNMFLVATDSGTLQFFSVDEQMEECKSLLKFQAHESRIKSIKCLEAGQDAECGDGAAERDIQFASASSDGLVKLWSASRRRNTLSEPQEMASVDVGARLTCMIATVRNKPA